MQEELNLALSYTLNDYFDELKQRFYNYDFLIVIDFWKEKPHLNIYNRFGKQKGLVLNFPLTNFRIDIPLDKLTKKCLQLWDDEFPKRGSISVAKLQQIACAFEKRAKQIRKHISSIQK